MTYIVPSSMRSWVPGADDTHFPIQNLPYGKVFNDEGFEIDVIRIGDWVLNVDGLIEDELLPGEFDAADPLFMVFEKGTEGLAEVREAIVNLLRSDAKLSEEKRNLIEANLIPLNEVEVTLPCSIGAYVDFYSGIHHASNVGKMFRPDMPPLLPNYKHIPIAYNGRASSVVVSGTPIVRPNGQTRKGEDAPTFGPTKELDFELEMGFFTSTYSEMGLPVPISEIDQMILGLVLVNDWSARDVQRWEYQPLGPFLAKTFGTTISPWVVPFAALDHVRIPGMPQDPQPLPYLQESDPRSYDIQLEVLLQTRRAKNPQVISKSNSKHLYWSFRQQLAHQCSNGTPIGAGDLYASGTISGPNEGEYGSLLELTWRGSQPITIEETGETRTFLEDGDTLTLRGLAEGDGFTIGLGDCTGTIVGSHEDHL